MERVLDCVAADPGEAEELGRRRLNSLDAPTEAEWTQECQEGQRDENEPEPAIGARREPVSRDQPGVPVMTRKRIPSPIATAWSKLMAEVYGDVYPEHIR